jgi:NAD(P)-dependent dehydrogenase (short-subunit alcohol dehydrogenase family)
MPRPPVAVVTGANRGLGRETCRQLAELGWTVVLTARDGDKAETTARELQDEVPGARIIAQVLDVTDQSQADSLAAIVRERFGSIDALVNNAGAMIEHREANSVLGGDPELVLETLDVNTVGALRVSRALAPLVAEAKGNIVNVSSGLGSLSEMSGGNTGYRLSKAALNALTRVLHAELAGDGVRVNAVCPGWVRTDMGGEQAARTIPEGGAGIVWAATLDEGGPSGGFFRDGQPLAW